MPEKTEIEKPRKTKDFEQYYKELKIFADEFMNESDRVLIFGARGRGDD